MPLHAEARGTEDTDTLVSVPPCSCLTSILEGVREASGDGVYVISLCLRAQPWLTPACCPPPDTPCVWPGWVGCWVRTSQNRKKEKDHPRGAWVVRGSTLRTTCTCELQWKASWPARGRRGVSALLLDALSCRTPRAGQGTGLAAQGSSNTHLRDSDTSSPSDFISPEPNASWPDETSLVDPP